MDADSDGARGSAARVGRPFSLTVVGVFADNEISSTKDIIFGREEGQADD